jgi:hypothetical protein
MLRYDTVGEMITQNEQEKKEKRQIDMFGMTEQAIREQYMESLTAKFSGLEMVVMGILSDSQELGAMGRTEAVRKQLNVAKFILGEMMDSKVSEI